ncbi:hypothetical protein NDU88_003952 [Pleurodeles waltl]|uniref:Uncharacterized protein n=1 Tax=Pleurodeles waltl TaxID=8319 RepID=A0AAV7NSE5_PLEWA|nr:hypothetical protein NDU88_003952 [Pleurodeles waltl]
MEPSTECSNRFAPLADLITSNDDGKAMRIEETPNQVDKLGEDFVGTQLNHLRGEIVILRDYMISLSNMLYEKLDGITAIIGKIRKTSLVSEPEQPPVLLI